MLNKRPKVANNFLMSAAIGGVSVSVGATTYWWIVDASAVAGINHDSVSYTISGWLFAIGLALIISYTVPFLALKKFIDKKIMPLVLLSYVIVIPSAIALQQYGVQPRPLEIVLLGCIAAIYYGLASMLFLKR